MLAQATLQKLRNAESSLVFMREQHARTLEGLHEEIHKLQKKNASEFNLSLFCLLPLEREPGFQNLGAGTGDGKS